MFRPKVIAYLVVFLLVLGAGFLLFSRSLTGQDYLKDFFLFQLEQSVGRKIEVNKIKFVAFPRIRLELSDVTIHDREPGQILLQAKRIDLVLRLLPLLRKQVVGKRLLIEDPHLTLRRDKGGQWNFSAATQDGASQDDATIQALWRIMRLREATVVNGILTLTDDAAEDGPRMLQFKAIDAAIKLQPERTRADLRVSATIPGQQGVTAFSISGLATQAETPPSFTAEDTVQTRQTLPVLQFEGTAEAANVRLRDLASFFGPHPVPEGIQGSANLRSHVRIVPGVAGYDMVLTDTAANLDQVTLQGKASLAGLLTAQPTYSVTMSSSPIELSQFIAQFPSQWIHPQLASIVSDRQIAGSIQIQTATITGSTQAGPQLSLTGEFLVKDGRALIGEDRVPAQNLSASVFVETGRVRVANLTGTYGAIQISEGKAMVSFLQAGPWLELEVSGDMSAAELFRFLATTIQSDRLSKLLGQARDVEGMAFPTFRLVGPLNQPGGVTFVGGDVVARHISLTTPAFPERVTGLQGIFRFTQNGAQLDQVTGHVGDAQFQLQGTITGGTTSAFQDFLIRIRGDAAQMSHWFPAYAMSKDVVQGIVSATLTLSGSTATPHLRGDLVLTEARMAIPDLSEKPAGAPAAVEFEGNLGSAGTLTLTRLELILPPVRLASKGKIQLGEKFLIDASLATGTISLSGLPEWLVKGGIEAGNFELSLDVKATERDWKTWRITGWVALTNGLMLAKGLDGHVQDLYLRMKLVRTGAELKRLSFRINDSDVNLTGTIKNWATKPAIAVKIESSQMDIDLLIPKGARSPLREFLELLAATSRVSALASIERGVYRKMRFGGLSCRITIEDGVLDVDRIVGQSDTGSMAGRLVVHLPRQAPAETEASLRVTGIPFEEVLPLLGSSEHWVTGDLKLSGTLRGHGRNPHGLFPTLGGKASVVIEDGRVLKNENRAIWKVLSLLNLPAVLQGKVDLDKDGLPFRKFSGTLTVRNGLIEAEDIILDSPVLKITAAGNYDLPTDQLDMVWAVSPFGSYSQFLKTIPLFGRIFAGDRKGIATALFQVKGSIEDPEVTYLPMKSLATGLSGLGQLAFDVLKNTLSLPIDLVTPDDDKNPSEPDRLPEPEALTPAPTPAPASP